MMRKIFLCRNTDSTRYNRRFSYNATFFHFSARKASVPRRRFSPRFQSLWKINLITKLLTVTSACERLQAQQCLIPVARDSGVRSLPSSFQKTFISINFHANPRARGSTSPGSRKSHSPRYLRWKLVTVTHTFIFIIPRRLNDRSCALRHTSARKVIFLSLWFIREKHIIF